MYIHLSKSILSSMDITKRKRKEKSKHESKNTRSVKIMIGFEITVVYVCICMQREREREAAMKRNVQCALAWRWFASTTFSSLSSVNRRNKSCSSSLAINNTKIIIKQQKNRDLFALIILINLQTFLFNFVDFNVKKKNRNISSLCCFK
jgi:hypothetical protein